jgi:hypothetical protein
MDYMAISILQMEVAFAFKAINPRKVNGILFQDYVNYKPKSDAVTIGQIESLYKQMLRRNEQDRVNQHQSVLVFTLLLPLVAALTLIFSRIPSEN